MELPRLGEVFEDRYEILGVLGEGGFATVYHATDRAVSRPVVIKVLSPLEGGYAGPVRARFLREAKVFAGLHDPHTITMFDFGESRTGLLYMVFEHIAGRDLSAVLTEHRRLSPPVVCHILEQLLSALREAHDQGILHRDIKPANVLIYAYDGDPYRVKLIDFGIARDTTDREARVTRTGHVVGTVRYMAPEQLLGGDVSPASDLYSLGLVAFELLTGRPAIGGESQKEILRQQVSDEPLLVPVDVAPPGLRAAVEDMLVRDDAARAGSAVEVLRAVRACRAEAAAWVQAPAAAPTRMPAAPAEVPEPAPEPRNHLAILTAVPVLLGIAATIAFVATRDAEPEAAAPLAPARSVSLVRAEPAERPVADVHETDMGSQSPDGCGAPPPFVGPGDLKIFEFGTGTPAHIPNNYDPNVRYPVVLMFHRKFGKGESLLMASKLGSSADQHGFIALSFSSANPTFWDVAPELAVVQDVLAAADEQLCLDKSRIYAYGDESGSSFVRDLSCQMPLSAVAVTSVTTATPCRTDDLPPRLRIYGKHDLAIPPAGGQSCSMFGGNFPSAAEIDSRWKDAYQCDGAERSWGEFPGGNCQTWTCPTSPYVVCVTDSGNMWPHRSPVFESGKCRSPKPREPFPYRDVIWRFFEQEGRPIQIQVPDGQQGAPDN